MKRKNDTLIKVFILCAILLFIGAFEIIRSIMNDKSAITITETKEYDYELSLNGDVYPVEIVNIKFPDAGNLNALFTENNGVYMICEDVLYYYPDRNALEQKNASGIISSDWFVSKIGYFTDENLIPLAKVPNTEKTYDLTIFGLTVSVITKDSAFKAPSSQIQGEFTSADGTKYRIKNNTLYCYDDQSVLMFICVGDWCLEMLSTE